jgi:hypothetical protein
MALASPWLNLRKVYLQCKSKLTVRFNDGILSTTIGLTSPCAEKAHDQIKIIVAHQAATIEAFQFNNLSQPLPLMMG